MCVATGWGRGLQSFSLERTQSRTCWEGGLGCLNSVCSLCLRVAHTTATSTPPHSFFTALFTIAVCKFGFEMSPSLWHCFGRGRTSEVGGVTGKNESMGVGLWGAQGGWSSLDFLIYQDEHKSYHGQTATTVTFPTVRQCVIVMRQ